MKSFLKITYSIIHSIYKNVFGVEKNAYFYASGVIGILLAFNFIVIFSIPFLYINPHLYYELYPVSGALIALLSTFYILKDKHYELILKEVDTNRLQRNKSKIYSLVYVVISIVLYIIFFLYYPH